MVVLKNSQAITDFANEHKVSRDGLVKLLRQSVGNHSHLLDESDIEFDDGILTIKQDECTITCSVRKYRSPLLVDIPADEVLGILNPVDDVDEIYALVCVNK